jgi:hypothetical protein
LPGPGCSASGDIVCDDDVPALNLKKEIMTNTATPRVADNDIHKGAKEEERPGPKRSSHPGLDKNGLPNDPVAIAQDALGAKADQSQG